MLALVLFPTLGQMCDDLVLCASPALMRRPTEPGNPAYPPDAPYPRFWEAKGLQRDRKLQTPAFRYKRGLRQGCIDVCDDEVDQASAMHADPAMNMESQNRVVLFRSMPLAQWLALAAMLSATTLPISCFAQGTLEQRLACTPDVLRLCSAFIPNADQITTCLREKNAELSDACKDAAEAGIKQPPDASDGAGARERATR
jgi:hypothetical protein